MKPHNKLNLRHPLILVCAFTFVLCACGQTASGAQPGSPEESEMITTREGFSIREISVQFPLHFAYGQDFKAWAGNGSGYQYAVQPLS